MPLIPPVTFSARFCCSVPSSDLMDENGTFDLLRGNSPSGRNSQDEDLSLYENTFGKDRQESFGRN